MSSIDLTPGMGLTLDEMAILHGHAAGKSPAVIGKELDLTPPEIKLIEQDIRFKLQANSPMHMISRAFQLGILRVICLLLCFCTVTDLDDQAVRTRTARTKTTSSRTVRGGRYEITC